MGLIDKYKRWRHGRGYGIHSPYAYEMVREVLNPPRIYAYYAYHEIGRLRSLYAPDMPLRELFLIFRVVNRFKPRSVTIDSPDASRMMRVIVNLAAPDAAITARGGHMFLSTARHTDAAPAPDTMMAYFSHSSNPAFRQLADARPYGHVYANPVRGIMARLPFLPRQSFEIDF